MHSIRYILSLGDACLYCRRISTERLPLLAPATLFPATLLVLLVGNALDAKMIPVLYITMLEYPCLGLLGVTLYGLLYFAFLVLALLRLFLPSTCLAIIPCFSLCPNDSFFCLLSTDLARRVLAVATE